MQAVFGDRRPQLPVTAAKSYFGNLGAASGLVEIDRQRAGARATAGCSRCSTTKRPTRGANCRWPVEEAEAGASFLNVNVTPQGQASAVVIAKVG